MNDDAGIRQRISGRSVRAVAKARLPWPRSTRRASAIDDKIRRHTLALAGSA
jgi:hypothetical protein